MKRVHLSRGAFTAAGLVLVVATLAPASADAAGLYFSDRGVRPMGRAGAFVAGADDLHSIWYNPAGLAEAGTGVLVDAAWLRFGVDYTRELRVRDGDGNIQQFSEGTISGRSPVLPIPTMAASYNFGKDKEWTIAGGVIAPYVALASFDATVNGRPSPGRYMVGSFEGLLGIPGVWAAYKAHDKLRFGAGVMAFTGYFQTDATFTASPQDRLVGAPEQPEYDAAARVFAGPFFAPTANAGVTYIPSSALRIGISAQLPIWLSTPANVKMRLPTASIFDNAKQVGEDADMRIQFPAILRAGVEIRPSTDVRFEVAYVREFWSIQKSIDVNQRISLQGVVGLPPDAKLPSVSIARGFQDAQSFRVGGEVRAKLLGYETDIRAGISYEESAIPREYLSLNALDFEKVTLSLGGTLHMGKHWGFDIVYAHLFASTVYVDPATAKVPRINPLKGNAEFEPVNGGKYEPTADLFGVGVRYKF